MKRATAIAGLIVVALCVTTASGIEPAHDLVAEQPTQMDQQSTRQAEARQPSRSSDARLMRTSQSDATAGQEGEISWMYMVTIKPGSLAALRDLIAEMAARAEANEPGTLTYRWTISEDGTTGHIHERYENSEAALTHLASYNENFAARLGALVESPQMFVTSDPSAALREQIAGAHPVYMENAGGFVR